MRSINFILDSIKVLKGLKTDAQLARLFSVKPNVLSTWRSRNTVPYKELIAFCEQEGLNLSAILSGKGPLRYEKRPLVGKTVTEYAGGFKAVDVYALAGAGRGRELIEPEPIDTIVLPEVYVRPGVVPVKVLGDSMEPFIYDGAVVGVDKNDLRIVSGKVYALWIDYEGAVIKRVFVEPGRIILRSDNPLCPDFSILKNDVHEGLIQGRVRWVFQKL